MLPRTGLTCTGGNNLPITGTITAGQNNSTPITLSCRCDHPNGKTITGTLVVKYYTKVVGDLGAHCFRPAADDQLHR
jgi:hypothetical protein